MNNNNTTYKDSPLGKIPGDWEVKRLGEICSTFKSGYGITSEEINLTGDYAVYGGNGLRGYTNKYTHEGNYFLIGRQGALCGNVLMVRGNNYISEHAIAVQTDNKNDNSFLAYKLEYQNLNRLSESSAQPGLSVAKLLRLKISLPPLPEQKAIAHVLGLIDSAINTNNQLIAKKELQKKWLMQNILTGKKRLKKFEKEKWEETSLGDLFERVTRKNVEQNTNVVTISAQRGFVRQTDFFNKSIASEIVDNYFLVEKGEFCYNKSYSNGYPWGAIKRLNDFEKAVVTTLYICFGLKNSQKNSGDFFEQYFEANLLDKGLTKIAHEGGRAHGLLNVTPSDFFSLKITIPTSEEQTAIAQVLLAADKEIQLLKAKTEKLREQKKGLMQVLLTGKKRLRI
jgi:type I restriction enzyme S subunit